MGKSKPPADKDKDKGKKKDAAANASGGNKKNKGKNDNDNDNAGEGSSGGSGKQKAANSINVRHILCEKHSKKEQAVTKLREGAKFDEVAREFSEDKARQGGALGWKVRGSLDAEFEKAAYALEVSTVASPKWAEVKTQFGYHVVMVEGRK